MDILFHATRIPSNLLPCHWRPNHFKKAKLLSSCKRVSSKTIRSKLYNSMKLNNTFLRSLLITSLQFHIKLFIKSNKNLYPLLDNQFLLKNYNPTNKIKLLSLMFLFHGIKEEDEELLGEASFTRSQTSLHEVAITHASSSKDLLFCQLPKRGWYTHTKLHRLRKQNLFCARRNKGEVHGLGSLPSFSTRYKYSEWIGYRKGGLKRTKN